MWRAFNVQLSTNSRLPVFEKGRYECKPCIQKLLYLYSSRCDVEHYIIIRRCAGFAKQGILVGHFTHVLAAVYTRSRDINQSKGSDSIIPTTQIFPTPLSLSHAPEKSSNKHSRRTPYNDVFATVHFLQMQKRKQEAMLTSIDYQAMMHALCKMTCQNSLKKKKKVRRRARESQSRIRDRLPHIRGFGPQRHPVEVRPPPLCHPPPVHSISPFFAFLLHLFHLLFHYQKNQTTTYLDQNAHFS